MKVEDRFILPGLVRPSKTTPCHCPRFSRWLHSGYSGISAEQCAKIEARLKALTSALDLPTGLPAHLVAAWPIPPTRIQAQVARALADDADRPLPVAGYLKATAAG